MKKFRPFIIALIILFIVQTVITPRQVDAAGKMPKGSKIGNVAVAGKTDAQIKTLLDTEIATWLAGDDFVLKGEVDHFYVPRNVIQFDVDGSINDLNSKTKRTWQSFFLRPKNQTVPLKASINKESDTYKELVAANYINVDVTLARMVDHAANFETAEIPIVYLENVEVSSEKLVSTKYTIPKLSNSTLKYIVDALDEYTIAGNSAFHLTDAIKLPEEFEEPSPELSFVATALYNGFLKTDFDIAERHTQTALENYTTYGRDVFVDPEQKKDFIVYNNSDHPYTISMKIVDGELHTEFMSFPSKVTYDFVIENERDIEPRKFYRFDESVTVGNKFVEQVGIKGRVVEVYRIAYENDEQVSKKLISRDVYMPVTEIYLVSPEEEISNFN